ncbi:fungal-specific transcription factor domain-containing protein [Stachybotrys elegans]|uniref:Fungal-specific transcription factor domain-containing protein n=1 Tax=Stachybotrys elegans TaxID=80388 RepID=A0A8K0SVW2_9HYPO|nr:fungal-specific transcription factor domain-containing protein [Stachybotrys elegans]
MAPNRSTRFTRSSNACDPCRQRKVKCTGSQPCHACTRGGHRCVFGDRVRRGYSEAYVKSLLDTIKQQQENHDVSQPTTTASDGSPVAIHHPSPALATLGQDAEDNNPDDDQEYPSNACPELAPGPAFETRVRSILRKHAVASSPNLDDGTGMSPGPGDEAPTQAWGNTAELIQGSPPPPMLSRDESMRLFDVFVSLLGINQHFLDPRKFADSIDLLYLSDTSRSIQMESMWFNHYLLVMAMGMLIGSPSDDPDRPPGSAFFAEALRRLPPTYELGSYGIVSVEVLSLAAVYLQWCDRKNEAYLYVGMAVRLAVALGCALPRDEQAGLSSEKCHRNRVWWTVYMLDRRLSAALGLPMSIDERQIRANLPKAAPGFQQPLPLIINIQIARATGEIMTSFYGNTTISQADLVKRIQHTLQSLYETGRSIPSKFVTEFENPGSRVSRTNASLYLMLFQAIILCIRPVILQCVKDKVEATQSRGPRPPVPRVIAKLCRSCQEAASKSINILTKLREDKSIALFGYFDLDATFSAAFILAMVGFINSDEEPKPPQGLDESARILKYLCKAGNKAAERRLYDLKQFCRQVWTQDKVSDQWAWLREETTLGTGIGSVSDLSGDPGSVGRGNQLSPGEGVVLARTHTGAGASTDPAAEFQDAALSLNLDDLGEIQWDLEPGMSDIYESFNDPNLPLTGIDDADWAAVGRIFQLDP